MYTAGVLPVGQQRYTATIITTTPNKNGSYIMDQARKTDSKSNPLLPQLLLGDPCKECKAKGEYVYNFFISFSLFAVHSISSVCSCVRFSLPCFFDVLDSTNASASST